MVSIFNTCFLVFLTLVIKFTFFPIHDLEMSYFVFILGLLNLKCVNIFELKLFIPLI
jgi:hypothetical protein